MDGVLSNDAGYIDSLTALRGIAALWVVVFHYDSFLEYQGLTLADVGTTMLVKHGYLMVDFFFILSGFIITHVYGNTLRTGGKSLISSYLIARFRRLYPLHIFCLLLLALMAFVLRSTAPTYFSERWADWFKAKDFLAYACFGISFGLVRRYSWNLPAWSIAAEWWTYIAAIFLLPLIHTGFGRRTWWAWLAGFGGLTMLSVLRASHSLDFALNLGLLRCLLEFTIGVGVYQLYRKLAASRSVLQNDWVFTFVLISLLVMLHVDFYDVLTIPIFGIVILSAALNAGIPRRILNLRPLRYLGDISFSIYMLQFFWIYLWLFWLDLYWKIAHPNSHPTDHDLHLWLLLIVAAVIGSAALTNRLVEIPARRLGRRRLHITTQ